MSKRDHDVQLPEQYEELLTKWPSPERDEAFWEASAKKVSERLEGASWEATDDEALFAAPLPAEPDEGSVEPEAEPAPRSLAEIARMHLESEAAPAADNDIAKESLALGRQGRASAPVIAEATRAAAARLASERASAPAPAAPVSALPAPPQPKKSALAPIAMAGIGLLGLAAAAAIVMRSKHESAPPLAAATAPAATPAPTALAHPTTTVEEGDIVAIDDLGPGKAGAGATAPRSSNGDKVALKAPEPAGKGGVAEATKPSPEAPPTAKPEPQDDFDQKKKPAAIAGDIPEKPSTGAVQAAIGAVMGGARACVAGQDGPSSATVSFGSDGKVSSVSVAGPAAGTPAEACIKAALSKARVQPFARPSFSVGAKIRP
jgi:hypothetical protein